MILAAKGSPSTEQMKNINPLWDQEIDRYPALPGFLRKILIDETPDEAIDLITKLLEFEP